MSASLVGSEMCIRDRASPRRGPGSAAVAGGKCGAPLVRAAVRPASGRAVSYTHLTLPTICSV
eukprot:14703833-Alexandrium_andersonii.AAC.1